LERDLKIIDKGEKNRNRFASWTEPQGKKGKRKGGKKREGACLHLTKKKRGTGSLGVSISTLRKKRKGKEGEGCRIVIVLLNRPRLGGRKREKKEKGKKRPDFTAKSHMEGEKKKKGKDLETVYRVHASTENERGEEASFPFTTNRRWPVGGREKRKEGKGTVGTLRKKWKLVGKREKEVLEPLQEEKEKAARTVFGGAPGRDWGKRDEKKKTVPPMPGRNARGKGGKNEAARISLLLFYLQKKEPQK